MVDKSQSRARTPEVSLPQSEWQNVPKEGKRELQTEKVEPEKSEVAPATEKQSADSRRQSAPQQTPAVPATPKTQMRKNIESTLSSGINEFYAQMNAEEKRQFKAKAMETAGKIETMIAAGKVNVKKIVRLIRAWLSMIPGVNKLFLEQESKIKADKIVALKKQEDTNTLERR